MDPISIVGGLIGGLGSLFGSKEKQNESFKRDSESETNATAQDLNPELLKILEGLFKSGVSTDVFSQSQGAMSDRLKQIQEQAGAPQFDVAGFAKGIVDQASSAAGLELESGINQALTQSGGSEKGNSMSALLANKLRNSTAANLAGISSQATATGEQIRQAQQGQITESIAGLSGSLSDQIMSLIGATRGASNIGNSKTKEHTEGVGRVDSSSRGNPFDVFGSFFKSFNNAREDA